MSEIIQPNEEIRIEDGSKVDFTNKIRLNCIKLLLGVPF